MVVQTQVTHQEAGVITLYLTRANAINFSASGWEALTVSGVVLTISMKPGEKL